MQTCKPTHDLMVALLLIMLSTACKKQTFETYLVATYATNNPSGALTGRIDSLLLGGPTNIATDTRDNLYLTDMGNHIIRKIDQGGRVTLLAGEGNSFADGVGRSAKFNYPLGIAVDATGIIYVADRENQRIRKALPNGQVSTLAGNGIIGSSDGDGKDAQFYNPVGIAVDAQGNLYIADSENHRIRKITPAGIVSTIAGTTRGYADGGANKARFNDPVDVALDNAENIYIVDRNNHCIRKITPNGTVSTVAGTGKPGFANGTGEKALFNGPRGITIDKHGNLYIADSGNNRIRKIASDGKVSTIAGNGTAGFANGYSEKAKFNEPWDIEVNANGDLLYVADRNNQSIRTIQLH